MTCYPIQAKDQILVKGCGFLSSGKNIDKNIGKRISKNVGCK